MLSSILPVTARPDTVMLPIDPRTPLTPEQDKALWGVGCVEQVLRDCHIAAAQEALARIATQQSRPQLLQPTPVVATMPNGVANG